MTRSARGVPAKPERGNSRSVAAVATAHRVRALLDEVLSELEAERARGGRDWRKKLVDSFHASDAPLIWLQQFREAAGVKDIEPGAAPGLGNMATAAFAGIFAAAAAQAAAQSRAAPPQTDDTALPIIDVSPVPPTEDNVQHKPMERDQPIDW